MKIEKKYQLNRIVGKEGESPVVLQHILFEKGKLVASNGHVLAVVPVKHEETDIEGYLTAESIKKANSNHGYINPSTDSLGYADGSTDPRPKDAGNYPSYEMVIPKEEPVITIGLNPKLLLDLAMALDSKEPIILEIYGEEKPIGIKTLSGLESGVIMPIRIK